MFLYIILSECPDGNEFCSFRVNFEVGKDRLRAQAGGNISVGLKKNKNCNFANLPLD